MSWSRFAATAVLASPLLFHVFFTDRTLPEHALADYPADLASLLVPGTLVAAAPERLGAAPVSWATGAAYMGLPLLILITAFAWVHRRRRAARLALIMFLAGAVAALGSALHVAGNDTGVPLPWAAFAELPLLRYAIPLRFSAFAFLAAAVIVAFWLTWRSGGARWALACAVVLSFVPAIGNAAWHTELIDVPSSRTAATERTSTGPTAS